MILVMFPIELYTFITVSGCYNNGREPPSPQWPSSVPHGQKYLALSPDIFEYAKFQHNVLICSCSELTLMI